MPEAIASTTESAPLGPAEAVFQAAFLAATPEATVAGAPAATPAAREDGISLPEGLTEALQSAGIDPLKATAQEIINFSNHGAKTFFEQRQKEKKVRQTIEAEHAELKSALSGLALDTVFAESAQGEKVAEKLNSIKSQVSRLGVLDSNLLAAHENGLLSTETLEAIRATTPESAGTIFKLMAQVQGQQAKHDATRAAGVGTTVVQPTAEPVSSPDNPFALPVSEDFKLARGFTEAFKQIAKPK